MRVHDLVPPEEWEARYDKINAFERDLVAHGTTVLKCFLHISLRHAARAAARAGSSDPDKHWKFNEADIDERALWPKYQEAFQAMLERCDTAGRAVVRRAVRLEEVPQLGRRAAAARDARGARPAVPATDSTSDVARR